MTQPSLFKTADAQCDRCKRPLQLTPSTNPTILLRRASKPTGVCPDCAITQFLYNTYPLNMQIDEAGPELLLKPHIPQVFDMFLKQSGCDLDINEIDWKRVVDNWYLPVTVHKDPRNPYRMGDSPRAKKRRV